jgi:type IV secretory pathway protease TraF
VGTHALAGLEYLGECTWPMLVISRMACRCSKAFMPFLIRLIGYEITIDGAQVGQALERDYRGRPLPHWQGCRLLEDGDVFLMNWHPRSLDERHFGVLPDLI